MKFCLLFLALQTVIASPTSKRKTEDVVKAPETQFLWPSALVKSGSRLDHYSPFNSPQMQSSLESRFEDLDIDLDLHTRLKCEKESERDCIRDDCMMVNYN
eukprot:Pgem_evm1s11384